MKKVVLVCAALLVAVWMLCASAMAATSDFVISNGVLTKYTGSDAVVVVPDGVTSIGNWAFDECNSLTSVTLPDSVTSIGDHAFEYCRSLTSITLPAGLRSIGYGAFWGCASLTSITLPDGVTSIGNFAFYSCRGLTSITLPQGITSIGDFVFRGCSSLMSIILPDSITSIGSCAFESCSRLTSITLPASLRSIGYGAFEYCSALSRVYLPSNITSFGDRLFSGSTTIVVIPGSATAATLSQTTSYDFIAPITLTLPAALNTIDEDAFAGSAVEMVIIPDGCTSIGAGAFADMPNLHYVQLPEGTQVAEDAFSGSPVIELIRY